MKLLCGATVLLLSLLLGSVPQSVYAADADDLTDADGLPVATPIMGQFTVPPLADRLLMKAV
jgi:hypothetical protein